MARLLLRDLTPGTNYKIQIRAVDGDSVSEWSRRFDLITTADTIAPDTPNWISSRAWVVSGDAFVATWEPLDRQLEQNKDLSHYEIELSDGTTSSVIRTNNTSYTLTFDQNVIFFGTPRATVHARVRSVDEVGNASAWSEQKSATNPPPPPVDSVSATPLYDAIDVKWVASDMPDDFQAFVVQVSTTSSATGFTTVYEGPSSQYQHATTMFLTDHWFRVFVRDKFNSMSASVTSGAVRPKSTFQIDDVPPAMPINVTASIANSPDGIGAVGNVSWTQPSPVEDDLGGFRIRWRKPGDLSYFQADASFDDRSAIVELQYAYQNYEFQVRSYDKMGNPSEWTPTVLATSPDAGTPDQITGLDSVAGRTSMRYSWTPSSITNLREYEVTFSTSSTFASGNITFKTGTSPHLDIGGLDADTTYYARVRAVNAAGTPGAWSASNTSTTLPQLSAGDIGAPTMDDIEEAKQAAIDAAKIADAISGSGSSKTFHDVLSQSFDDSETSQFIMIDTPIVHNGSAVRVTIEGYNRKQGETDINLVVGFYADGTTTSPQSQTNFGSKRALAWLYTKTEDNTVSIAIQSAVGDWEEPSIRVSKVEFGGAEVPDSWATSGWSSYPITDFDIPGYEYLGYPPFRDLIHTDNKVQSWTYIGTTEINGDSIRTSTIDAMKIKANSVFTQNLHVASTFTVGAANMEGTIRSYDYVAGSEGWRLNKTNGLELNKGIVKADTIRAGNLGGPSGINSLINITAGTSLVLNGGYIKSNTNTGTTMATAEASGAGFYLGNDGLFIGTGGKVKANALVSDTLTSTTITLGEGGEIKAAGWTINSSGITIPNGAISAASLSIGPADANQIFNNVTSIDGGKITTGSIQSNANAVDADGNPIPGVKAWMIDLDGNAVLGDVLVRGSMIMGIEDESQTSILKSYGYVSGDKGWAITSDGKAEFNDVTVRGEVSSSSITSSTMTGGLISGTQIVSVDNATLNVTHKQRSLNVATLFFSEPHGRAVGDRIRVTLDQSVAVDTSFDTIGDTFATITNLNDTAGDYWISYDNPGSARAKTTHAGTVYVEGRSVVMSSSGLRLVSNDGQTNIINLSTLPGEPAHFSGSIETDSIVIEDHLVLNGTENMMSMGSILTLNSKVVPPGRPTATYSWDTTPVARNPDRPLYTMTGVFSKGFQFDGTRFISGDEGVINTASAIITTIEGNQQRVALDKIPSEYSTGTWGTVYVGGKYFRLARRLVTTNYFTWHLVRHSASGTVEAVYLYDRKSTMGGNATQWGSVWRDVSGNFGKPIIGTDGTSIYIARAAGSTRRVWVAKYSTNGAFQSERDTNLVIPTRMSAGVRLFDELVSLAVGDFDLSGPRYIISVSDIGHNKNYSIRQSDGIRMTDEDWDAPSGQRMVGVAWRNGSFYSLVQNGDIYHHTSLAKSGAQTASVSATWYNNSSLRETPRSASLSTTMVRRSKMTVSAGKLPPSALGQGPDRARFYIGSTTTPVWGGRQTNPNASSTQSFTDLGVHTPATTWATGTNFGDGTPAAIRSNNGLMEITSDGRAIFGASDDVSTSAGNRPALILGAPNGNHLRMDGDEIISMANDNTQGILYLNDGGETYSSRMVLTSVTDANTSAGNKPALRIGNINGSHLRIDDNEIISMSSNTVQSNLLLNPGGNVNFGSGTVAGAGGGFTVGTQLDVPNMTSGNGPNVTFNDENGRLRVVRSSRRFKDNIRDYTINPDRILDLPPREYERNDFEREGDIHEVGFIAEEAEELGLSEFVFYDRDGLPFSFDYSRWVVVLQGVARHQREQINELKQEKELLESRLSHIEAHLGL